MAAPTQRGSDFDGARAGSDVIGSALGRPRAARDGIESRGVGRASAGAAAGSPGAGTGEGDGERTLWETRTAEAPSPTQNALHAVLIHRSIVIVPQASAVPTSLLLEYADKRRLSDIPSLSV